MKYAELDDKAKERARDKVREWQVDHDWWSDTYEDAVRIGKLLGIEISTRSVRGVTKVYDELEISFRGFYSQGDGCCFSGEIHLGRCATAPEQVAAEAPHDEDLAELAQQAKALFNAYTVELTKQRLLGEEGFVAEPWFHIKGEERYWRTALEADELSEEFVHLESTFNEFVSAFAGWIYEQLEAEYGHLTSDETVEEAILANDYDFDEEGRM